jgi:phosphoribosylformimino-5-aminoimidazole carboxamide ribotide isomerase
MLHRPRPAAPGLRPLGERARRGGYRRPRRHRRHPRHGRQQTSGVSALDLARRMQALGVTRVVYTDIGRDDTLAGVNATACAGLAVIASGGVATLDDIRRVKAVEADGVEGVIVGKALYAGQVDLVKALEVVRL